MDGMFSETVALDIVSSLPKIRGGGGGEGGVLVFKIWTEGSYEKIAQK